MGSGPVKRTNVCEIGFHGMDYVVVVVTLALAILYIYLSGANGLI